nr:MAG TPA: hypothetical protein [Crassvirales sp.]
MRNQSHPSSIQSHRQILYILLLCIFMQLSIFL